MKSGVREHSAPEGSVHLDSSEIQAWLQGRKGPEVGGQRLWWLSQPGNPGDQGASLLFPQEERLGGGGAASSSRCLRAG